MRRLLITTTSVIAAVGFGVLSVHAQAPDPTSVRVGFYAPEDVSPVLPPKPACDIASVIAGTPSDVQLASASLSYDQKLHSYVEVRLGVLKVYKDYIKDIAVRVLNTTTCTTSVITVKKTYGMAQMNVPVATRTGTKWTIKNEPVAVLQAPAGWAMSVVRRANGIEWNNWNTQFAIASPSDSIVVGVKYPIVNDAPKKGQPRVTEFINVPYSEPIAVADVIAEGQRYVADTIAKATDDLRARGVVSRALPGMLIADVIAKYPKAFPIDKIMPIEHMDLTEFILDPQWTTNRVYATIGANGDMFASFTCSPAGACGPQQFIASSYTMVRKAYPAAGLVTDTNTGRRQALNSMKAAILLLDLQLADYVKAFGTAIMSDPHIDELQFAGYNTGTKRVTAVYRIALKKNSPDWVDARGTDCRKPTYRQCLLSETKGYVQDKFRYLRDEYTASAPVAVRP
ncbi:MAG TPA: hypothetical protein VMU12_00530 [Candidatus Paceibacterota bacterium]|nr:hypothetical protein [Candidatus Paceibacterota bacterium]